MKKYRITVEGIAYEVEVEEVGSGPAVKQPVPAGRPAPVQPPQRPGSGTAVKAPMPGTILAVNVTAGQQVAAGDILLILEAMKMENEILAPAAGRVTSVTAAQGTAVNTGDVLVTLE